MKASKIRIVVILLLIIFFGLLILFGWSRNIYEGLPQDASIYVGNDKKKTLDFTTDSTFKIDKITTVTVPDEAPPAHSKDTAKTVLQSTNSTDCYFIGIYYFTPKVMKTPVIKGADLPIAFINHNLPDGYNLYFSNSNANAEHFGGNISPANTTAVYIEKTVTGTTDDRDSNYDSRSNKPNFIDKIKQRIAGGGKQLKDWDTTTQIDGSLIAWSSRFKGGTKIPDDASKIYLVNVPRGTTKPVAQEYKAASNIPKTSIIGSFNVQYNTSNNTTALIPGADDKNENVGLINLVNIYVKLK